MSCLYAALYVTLEKVAGTCVLSLVVVVVDDVGAVAVAVCGCCCCC